MSLKILPDRSLDHTVILEDMVCGSRMYVDE